MLEVPWGATVIISMPGGEAPAKPKERSVTKYSYLIVGVVVPRHKMYRTKRYNECGHKGIKKIDSYCSQCGVRANLTDETPIEGFDDNDMLFHDLTVIDCKDSDFVVGVSVYNTVDCSDNHDYDAFNSDELKAAIAQVRKVMSKTKLVKKPDIGVHLYSEMY